MKKFVITIGREYGSGGLEIGKLVAKKMNIPVYDKTIISLAAKESGIAEEMIKEAEQNKSKSFVYGIYINSVTLSLQDKVFIAESNVIKELASKESCVIIGRCADYVLRDFESKINIFIHAPLEYRAKKIEEEKRVSVENYEKYVEKRDKERASYYNDQALNKWGDARNYDICLNSKLGVDFCANIIQEAAEKLFGGQQ